MGCQSDRDRGRRKLDHMVTAMDKRERELLIERLQSENARMLADQAERRAAREAAGEYFDETPQAPIIRKTYVPPVQKQQQPTLDAQWADWIDARIDAKVSAALDVIADVIGTATGEDSRFLRTELKKLRDALEASDKALHEEVRALRDLRIVQDAISRGDVAEILRGEVSTRKRGVYQ